MQRCLFYFCLFLSDIIETYIISSDDDDDEIKEIFLRRLKSPPLNLVLKLSEDEEKPKKADRSHLKLGRPGRIFMFSSMLEAH